MWVLCIKQDRERCIPQTVIIDSGSLEGFISWTILERVTDPMLVAKTEAKNNGGWKTNTEMPPCHAEPRNSFAIIASTL